MSRPLRIEYAGAWYHVMNRGAGKKTIYQTKQHYELFLELLEEIHNRYQIIIHAYCLMSNHYHLLLQTQLPNLSRAMRHLDGVYTQRYNRSQNTDGALFRGRFKSIIVDENDYHLCITRYIHLNPVVAGLVERAEDYNWSSYSAYLSKRKTPLWLSTEPTLAKFKSKRSRFEYRIFVEEGIDRETSDFFSKIKKIPILGSDAFIKIVSEKYLSLENCEKNVDIPEQTQIKNLALPQVSNIISIVAEYYHVNVGTIEISNRNRNNKPRAIAIYLAYKLTNQTARSLLQYFHDATRTGISKIYQRVKSNVAQNKALKNEVEHLQQIVGSSLDLGLNNL